jgi:hypothetical protein
MTLLPDSDQQETPENGNVQNISGKNVVGSIVADGSAQVTIHQISYNQLSQVEEERERQQAELDVLQIAIAQKYSGLSRLADTPAPAIGNPYLFLQPFGFTDSARFFCREDEIAELCERVTHSTTTFLSGNSDTGKTSLLKAGLTPVLLKQKHLPLMVSVNSEPLEASLKKELLPNIDGMPFLKKISLTEFIRIVTSALPDGKMLFILVDDFEEFFNDKEHSELERNAFYNEWQRGFNGAAFNAHWVFCVPSNLQYLLNFFKREVQPNPNTISVSPFDLSSARAAVLKPAEGRHQDRGGVVTSILDILGGKDIDPAQLVCYMLAGGKGVPGHEWTMEYYVAQGKADGILRDYLDRTIEELEPVEREPAWQVLAVLADPSMRISTEQQLIEKLELYDVKENITHRVLIDLESNNLIERGPAFKLTSDSLLPRIEKWKETRSARERAREETMEQLRSIRNSALRGLLGGVVGFIVFDQILYKLSFHNPFFLFFKILFAAAIGALPGLVLVFSVDVAVASYSGPKKWLAYLGGALGGALALSWALIPYSFLINLSKGKPAIVIMALAILEGGLWGAVAGMGTVWALKSQRPYWITIPVCILISGLTLIATNSNFHVLEDPLVIRESVVLIGLAGAALPAFILAAAVIGRRKVWSSRDSHEYK